MRQVFFWVFVAVLAANVFADELLYRNGASVSGKFVFFEGNAARFVAGGDTLILSGAQVYEIRLNDGGRVRFDNRTNRFFRQTKKDAAPGKRADRACLLVGATAAVLAVNEVFIVKDFTRVADLIGETGVDGGEIKSTRNRHLIMAVIYAAISGVALIAAGRDPNKEKP